MGKNSDNYDGWIRKFIELFPTVTRRINSGDVAYWETRRTNLFLNGSKWNMGFLRVRYLVLIFSFIN